MSKDLSRRKFLERIGLGTAAGASLWLLKDVAAARPAVAGPLPSRTLGRTGAKVSILAFGCGSRFLMYQDEDKALAALNRAIDLGITYLDTAYAYGDGKSETRVGKAMATRRKEVWLATKIPDRTRDEFLRRLEGSLKRLQVDHVDLVHIHSLGQADDLAKIEAPDGALKGATGSARTEDGALHRHDQPHQRRSDGPGHRAARSGLRADGARMPRVTGASKSWPCRPPTEEPRSDRHEGDRAGVSIWEGPGKADISSLLRYSMSLPVTTAVVGMPHLEMLEHNIEVARSFSPLPEQEMERLRTELTPARAGMEKKLRGTPGRADGESGSILRLIAGCVLALRPPQRVAPARHRIDLVTESQKTGERPGRPRVPHMGQGGLADPSRPRSD